MKVWVTQEASKSEGISVVLSEILSFTEGRARRLSESE